MSTKTQKLKDSKIQVVPAPGYVLVEPFEAEVKTAGGLYLPENAAGEKPQKGNVLAVGDDEVLENGKTKKSFAKRGQKVIYKKWGGNEYKQDGKEYLFVKFEDVLAIIK